jgi:hypothetical protein
VNLLQKIIAGFLAILIIPFAILVISILNVLGLNKANLESTDVLGYLHKMKNGEVDDYWWDDFLSVPIKNEALDQIRESCNEVWDPQSRFLKRNEDGLFELNQVGYQRIEELIIQTKRLSNVT